MPVSTLWFRCTGNIYPEIDCEFIYSVSENIIKQVVRGLHVMSSFRPKTMVSGLPIVYNCVCSSWYHFLRWVCKRISNQHLLVCGAAYTTQATCHVSQYMTCTTNYDDQWSLKGVCLNMFFYDWSNINRYSLRTMQHVTAVKIGGGGRHYMMFYYMA